MPCTLTRLFLSAPHLTVSEFSFWIDSVLKLSRKQAALFLYLCDLLCTMLIQHSHRSQYFILSSGISPKIAMLLRTRDKHMHLGKCCCFRPSSFDSPSESAWQPCFDISGHVSTLIIILWFVTLSNMTASPPFWPWQPRKQCMIISLVHCVKSSLSTSTRSAFGCLPCCSTFLMRCPTC